MDVRRHATAGRLAEMFGADALETDKMVRTMGWRRVAERELALLQPRDPGGAGRLRRPASTPTSTSTRPARSRWSTRCSTLGGLDYRPEDWTPVDSLAWLKAMAWDLRGNLSDEIDRVLALADRSAAEVRDLYPAYPFDEHRARSSARAPSSTGSSSRTRPRAAPATRSARRSPPSGAHALAALRRGLGRMPALLGRGDGIGSNSWVVDGAHSATGQPAAGQRPAPRPPRCRASGCRWACTAARSRRTARSTSRASRSPACPGVVIGHNADIAWGFTNLGPDVTDLYLEKVAGDRWRYDGEWRPLRTRTETIKVAGGDDVDADRARPPGTARCSPTSPTSSPTSAGARRWTAGRAPTAGATPSRCSGPRCSPAPTADAILALDTATDWDSFRAAAVVVRGARAEPRVRRPRGPHRLPGARAGSRSASPATTGWCPSAGWRPENDWTGDYVPVRRAAERARPGGGVRRHRQPGRDRPGLPLPPHRRLGPRLPLAADPRPARASEGELSVDEMASLQLDDRSPMAPVLVPYLLDVRPAARLLPRRPAAAAATGTSPRPPTAAPRRTSTWCGATCWPADLPRRPARGAVARRRRPLVRGGRAGCSTTRPRPWWDDAATDGASRPATTSCAEAMIDARDEMTRRQALDPRRAGPGATCTGSTCTAPTLGESGHRAGRVAVQPRRLEGRRRQRDRRRHRRGTPPRATSVTARRRCGWWSRSATSTTPAGST